LGGIETFEPNGDKIFGNFDGIKAGGMEERGVEAELNIPVQTCHPISIFSLTDRWQVTAGIPGRFDRNTHGVMELAIGTDAEGW
jgi:hypothetical protein